MPRILFVCMGNICRSPSAEGVFRHRIEAAGLSGIEVDSAGTHAYHVGAPPDPRSAAAALRRGIDIGTLRGRQVSADDFEHFDYILAMDEDNYQRLLAQCPPEHHKKVRLFLSFAPHLSTRELPDPYYGGEAGFEHVLDLIETASDGLLEEIRARLEASNEVTR